MGLIRYKNLPYGGGSSVEANPQDTPTDDLETIKIDEDVFTVKDADAVHADDDEISFTEASERTNITSGDTLATMLGKIKKWFTDLKDLAFVAKDGTNSTKYLRGDATWQSHDDVTHTFSQAGSRTNLSSGEKITVSLGKIMKWFADLKDLAFIAKDGTSSTKYLRGDGTWQTFPTIPAAQVNSDWNASSGVAEILNKPTLATVATSGSYNDLSNKPTIPTVNNGTLTIQKNGTQVATFSANQSGNATANITVPDVSETDTTDTTPYLYRASNANGDRCYLEKLVGASFGMNQLATFSSNIPSTGDGITYTAEQNNSVLLTGTCNNTSQRSGWFKLDEEGNFKNIVGHKVLFFSKAISGTASKNIKIDLFISGTPQHDIGDTFIKQVPQNYRRLYWSYESGCVFSNYRITFNCIDLTQMFGTAIADKAYTMEQTTAGSGIAWLKSYGFFTESYYPYSTGSLQSVQTSGKANVGKNLFNPYATQDTTYASATFANNVLTVTGRYYVGLELKLLAGTYTISMESVQTTGVSGFRFVYQDGTMTNLMNVTNYTYTFDQPVVKFLLYAGANTSATSTYKKLQIERGSTATSYEPYTHHTTILPNIELRGVAQLSGNDIVYDGDVENADGSVERKYGIVDLGTIYYSNASATSTYYCSISNRKMGNCKMIIGNNYSYANPYLSGNDKCYMENSDSLIVYFKDSAYTDVATFKTSMSGVYLVYELATPTTEQTSPIQNPQVYNSNGTEQFIDNRTVPIPVGHESRYVDLPQWMEEGYVADLRYRVDEALPLAIANSKKYYYATGSVGSGKTGVQKIAQITLSEVGTYFITGWAKFTGSGKKAVQLWCSGTLGESWEDSTIAIGEPKTFSTFAVYTSTVANEDVKVNSYTVSTSNAVTGGLVAIKIA